MIINVIRTTQNNRKRFILHVLWLLNLAHVSITKGVYDLHCSCHQVSINYTCLFKETKRKWQPRLFPPTGMTEVLQVVYGLMEWTCQSLLIGECNPAYFTPPGDTKLPEHDHRQNIIELLVEMCLGWVIITSKCLRMPTATTALVALWRNHWNPFKTMHSWTLSF